MLIHIARGSYIAIAYPPHCRWGLLAIVYRLPALHAGATLGIAHPCCRWDHLPHMAYGIAFAIAFPCRIRDCLLMVALHVNAYAPSTPPPWSIPRLSQPPLQRRPSTVTLAAHSSTHCSLPVCARFWLAPMPNKAHFGRTFLDLSALAGRSVSVSFLAKHGAVRDAKFDQLLDIASRPGHPNCQSQSEARFSPVSGPSNDWPLCCGLPHASSSHYSTTQSDITVSKESQEERTMASMRR